MPGPRSQPPMEGKSMATETHQQEQDTGLKQTMIWLGAMIAGVVVVAYFYI